MPLKNVFITVGTTEFENLIEILDTEDMVNAFKEVGVEKLVIQYGTGKKNSLDSEFFSTIDTKMFSLKANISDEIEEADMVIGHAGAGTCLEVLNRGKPMIVVINDTLMDNHQTELATELAAHGYVKACTVPGLPKTLLTAYKKPLKQIEKADGKKFFNVLDNLMGYSELLS